MINWETLQFQTIPIPVGDKKDIIGAFIFCSVFVVLFFLASYLYYADCFGKEKIKKRYAILPAIIMIICSFVYTHNSLKEPYYKVSVEVEKPVGFEKQLLKIEEDKEDLKLADKNGNIRFTRRNGAYTHFKPYLDCLVIRNSIKVSTTISKKNFENFETMEDFKNNLADNVFKQIDFVKKYESQKDIEKEKKTLLSFQIKLKLRKDIKLKNKNLEYILEDNIRGENLELIKKRYGEADLKDIRILKIGETKYIYDRRKITITAELISNLSDLNIKKNPVFLEMRNGGLMFS